MFTRIQTRSFRCLKSVDQTLGRFCALVGPNASGKTTFLDVIALLGDLVKNRGDVLHSVQQRSGDFEKLLWMGQGKAFQLAVEAKIPEAVHTMMAEDKQRFSHVRYEVEIAMDAKRNEIGLNHETLWLRMLNAKPDFIEREIFPAEQFEQPSIFCRSGKGFQAAMNKKPGGNDNYYPDGKKKTFKPSYKLGWKTCALASIPADTESFPVSTWFRDLLEKGVQTFVLNSQLMRQPSPPGLGRRFQTDGSNLSWVIAELRKDAKRFRAWLDHVCTALEDIKDIDTVELPENKHRYLVVEYKNGARVPSWLVSDGTLRLLTLTIPAYLHDLEGTFLIEEPENGIHPRAIETVLQSLSSVYRSQVLVATHSPVALNMLKPEEILCFAKDTAGATDIVSGDKHPALRDWKKGEPDLGVLFASGIFKLSPRMKDLFILVADKNAEYALKGALARPQALGIRSIEFEIRTHPGRDGGTRKTGPELLALSRRQFHHGLLILDFEGSGTDLADALALETALDARLHNQWQDLAKAIVIEPELDIWIWGSDNAVELSIEWPVGKGVRDWLREQGFEFDVNEKPVRPKEALEAALRVAGLPRSSALYQHIASRISLPRCKDAAFVRLRNQLLGWFPN